MILAGLDPSLSNFGMVKGSLSGELFTLTDLTLVTSEPDNKNKKQVRKNSDDLNRARKLHQGLMSFIKDVDLLFVEIPVGSQSARSMASYGICLGLLGSIQIPMIQVTPAEVKLAATGSKTASKSAMITWATTQFPDAGWFTRKVKGVVSYTNKNEHPADALAAIYAGVRTDQYQQITAFNKGKT